MRSAARHAEILARLSAAVAGFGLLLRFTLRDGVAILAPIHYALPLAVIAVFFALAAGLWLAIRRRRLALAAFVLGIGCFGAWLRSAWFTHSPGARSDESVRVVFWNTARLPFGPLRALERILEQEPDLAVLVESGGMTHVRPGLPDGYQVAHLGAGLTVLARGEISEAGLVRWGERNRVGICSVMLRGVRWPILAVDLDSHPLAARAEALQRVAEISSQQRPVILCGDFNTPADATGFSVLRVSYQEVFETRGFGLHATWPSMAPVLALDQIWVPRSVEVLAARYVTRWESDHRMVVADLNRAAEAAP